MPNNQVQIKDLYQSCDEKKLGFKTTDDLKDLKEFLGQKRAIEALGFGVGIQRKGFNLFVLGNAGTGRHSVVNRYLDKVCKEQETPMDCCYVHNFDEPDQPKALLLPPGLGKKLKADMHQAVKDLKVVIPAAFDDEAYRRRKMDIEEFFRKKRRDKFKVLEEDSEKQGIALMETQTGFVFAPKKDNKVVSAEEFESLPKTQRNKYEKAIEKLQQRLKELLQDLPKARKEIRQSLKKLNQDTAELAVGYLFDDLSKKHKAFDQVIQYLKDVKENIIENIDDFLHKDIEAGEEQAADEEEKLSFRIYDVNVIVDHSKTKGAPVVYESHPTYPNLVGRIELKPQMGSFITDFHYIKAGALHRANGGYLVLDAHKILMQPLGWESLKRILRTKEIRIESLNQVYHMATTVTLQPETIPLSIKVILIGDRQMYYMLSQLDPEFNELFKVAVDFEDQIPASTGNIKQYSRLLATMARKENMLPLTACAVARVIEQSHRLIDDHRKLSANILHVADILREADYWARKDKKKIIAKEEIQQAIDTQIHRVARIRDRMQDSIIEGTKLIDTKGKKVGQINGLSVISIGHFAFGQPTKISVTSSMGKGQVVDIEREAELGGSIHTKGVMIITQLLASRYSQDLPLSLSASIAFEQSYGMIDGDSASTAELCALISSLSEVPIKQTFAVTGSINQNGDVQAIGGVNEKIEGFFDICEQRGLNGEHAVIIPDANVKNLMLRKDVVEAIKNKKFAIYAVKHLDEAVELLTGETAGKINKDKTFPAGSVNEKVRQKLMAYAQKRFNLDKVIAL
ncbi:MAG TPA: ATP-binding protein [Oligoflexia bacterium]|nr:ATP-binding protein [Oligoflexia bacterium]HMR24944.1 ATP-binding protein [Oligoflexia bacterium]